MSYLSDRGHERVELDLYSPSGPLWPVIGRTLPLPFYLKDVWYSGFIWLRAGLVMGSCEHGNEYSNSIKGIELCEHYSLVSFSIKVSFQTNLLCPSLA